MRRKVLAMSPIRITGCGSYLRDLLVGLLVLLRGSGQLALQLVDGLLLVLALEAERLLDVFIHAAFHPLGNTHTHAHGLRCRAPFSMGLELFQASVCWLEEPRVKVPRAHPVARRHVAGVDRQHALLQAARLLEEAHAALELRAEPLKMRLQVLRLLTEGSAYCLSLSYREASEV